MTPLLFVDVETTGLDPDRHEVWEVGLVRRDSWGDREHVWQLPVDLGRADPQALTVGRYHERTKGALGREDLASWAGMFAELTHGGVFVAANPTFDASFLAPLLRRNGACPGWHYRLVCVESMAVGALYVVREHDNDVELPPVPWRGLGDLADRLAVDVDHAAKHTALGDARLVRDLYDAIVGT